MSYREKYENIDWSLPTKELMELTGLSKFTVRKNKALRGLKRPYRTHVDWKSIDWDKSNEMLAEETGCSISTVMYNRAVYYGITQQQCRADFYDSIDWERTDKDIAENAGIAASEVSSIRKKHGGKYKDRKDSTVFWESIDWNKSSREIVAETGFCYETVRANRLKHGHPASKESRNDKVYRMNFSLSDSVLAMIHGMTPEEVFALRLAATNHQKSLRSIKRARERGEDVVLRPHRELKRKG